jgi:hypothetical protein
MSGFNASDRHRSVVAETMMRLASTPGGMLVTAALRYTSQDPFAVTMVFVAEDSAPVEWVFARDLLVTGVRRPAGVGDVHVFPAGGSVVLDLVSPDGAARLVADADVLTSFADDMLAAVPAGREMDYIDLDLELAVMRREAVTGSGEL